MQDLLEHVGRQKEIDFEAWEDALVHAVLGAGRQILERLLRGIGCGRTGTEISCDCGSRMNSVGLRSKRIHTTVGIIHFRRSLYVCPECGKARFPGDEALGMNGGSYSPRLKRLMARAGSRTSFAEAEEDLRIYADINVNKKQIERVSKEVGRQVEQWMEQKRAAALRDTLSDGQEPISTLYISFDGTGVPMRSEELAGRRGRQPDASAKTREVKVGCVFTQTSLDEKGQPMRDPLSTSYCAAIESSDRFGWRIYAEAQSRGLQRAKRTVVLSDGARYNKSICQLHFPHALHIIDLRHAQEHLHDLSKLLLSDRQRQAHERRWLDLLDQGKIEKVAESIKPHIPARGPRRKVARKELAYFIDNKEHMRYDDFRKKGLFIGSGVIESACRTLVGRRLKNPGMFWSVTGANAIIASRCSQFSRTFETFWEQYAA